MSEQMAIGGKAPVAVGVTKPLCDGSHTALAGPA
jgi:hypothetical protein